MPVTGIKQVQQNMRRTFRDISDKKAPQFINAVLDIGSNHAKELTPMEYGALAASMLIDTDIEKNNVTGVVSFNQDYAAALEFGVWKPRPINMKEGPSTNMDATPHFLRKGFEDPESIQMIEKAKDIFKL
tara:strand:+ start:4383 stop:4772 length:390 start_codon:yes stop_codon:yes gene_type:complete